MPVITVDRGSTSTINDYVHVIIRYSSGTLAIHVLLSSIQISMIHSWLKKISVFHTRVCHTFFQPSFLIPLIVIGVPRFGFDGDDVTVLPLVLDGRHVSVNSGERGAPLGERIVLVVRIEPDVLGLDVEIAREVMAAQVLQRRRQSHLRAEELHSVAHRLYVVQRRVRDVVVKLFDQRCQHLKNARKVPSTLNISLFFSVQDHLFAFANWTWIGVLNRIIRTNELVF